MVSRSGVRVDHVRNTRHWRNVIVKREHPVPKTNVINANCVVCRNERLGKPFQLDDGEGTTLTIRVCEPCQQRFRDAKEIPASDIKSILDRLLELGAIDEYSWQEDELGPIDEA